MRARPRSRLLNVAVVATFAATTRLFLQRAKSRRAPLCFRDARFVRESLLFAPSCEPQFLAFMQRAIKIFIQFKQLAIRTIKKF